MGTTACGGKGSKGRAANGDRSVGAASRRRQQHTVATCHPPPPISQEVRWTAGWGRMRSAVAEDRAWPHHRQEPTPEGSVIGKGEWGLGYANPWPCAQLLGSDNGQEAGLMPSVVQAEENEVCAPAPQAGLEVLAKSTARVPPPPPTLAPKAHMFGPEGDLIGDHPTDLSERCVDVWCSWADPPPPHVLVDCPPSSQRPHPKFGTVKPH